ncbi:MAG: ACT domain-containing protein [Candidatus Thermoplasmatota archaeon]|nr:ACT domain-containing protein [Candidatus Thermoplasmatota archaeon]
MTRYEIIKIRETGKIEVPPDYAFELGMVKGAYFLLELSLGMKEVRLEQVALPGKNLVEIELILQDKPGVLSTISGIFARHRVNILFNESEEISEKEAALVAVVDVSEMDTGLQELQEEIGGQEAVIDISVKELE